MIELLLLLAVTAGLVLFEFRREKYFNDYQRRKREPIASAQAKWLPQRWAGGLARCPAPCAECIHDDHHTGARADGCYMDFFSDDPDSNYPAAKLGIETWWLCKHCNWWCERLERDGDGGPR